MNWFRCEFKVKDLKLTGNSEPYIISTKDYADGKENAIEQAIEYLINERHVEVLAVLSAKAVMNYE